MIDPALLQAVLDKLNAGENLSQQDQQFLRIAVQSQQTTLTTGERAVAIGGSADGAVIITGDLRLDITKEALATLSK